MPDGFVNHGRRTCHGRPPPGSDYCIASTRYSWSKDRHYGAEVTESGHAAAWSAVSEEGGSTTMGALGDELSRLRRGRGIVASDLQERVGPTIRALASIDPAESQEEARRRLYAFLNKLAGNLPEDLRLAFSACLALDEDVQHRFLDERIRWLAGKLQRDVRTARRRVDEAISFAEASAGAQTLEANDYMPGRWYLAQVRTLLRLDGEQPTAIEERTVVANVNGLTEFIISTGIPRPASAEPRHGSLSDAHKQRLELSVIRGGSLSRREQPAASYFRYFIQFPRPLDQGESHEVAVAVTIPGGQAFNPRYTHQPLHRCDEFDLRIRFGSRNLPARVWNIVGLPRGMVDNFADPDALVRPDAAGDIHLRYQYLRTGLAYGARWSFLCSRSVYPEWLSLHPTAGAGAPACIHQRFVIVLTVPVHRPLPRLT